MSVIFHLINSEIYTVPFKFLASSKVLEAALSDLHLKHDIELDVKPDFTEAFHFYVDFLFGYKPTIDTAEELFQCLTIEDYYEDKDFLIYLIPQAYKFWVIVYPYLPNDIEVWLRSPYEFIPVDLRTQKEFFDKWLNLNANKEVVLDGDKVYHTDLSYYDESRKQKKKVKIYHTVNGNEVGYSFKSGWYVNGQAQYRFNYRDGKPDGLPEGLYDNGQLQYRDTYKDGKLDGLSEGWYDNGQLQYRDTYKDGKLDGLQEAWYVNGQPEYRHIYKDGEEDSLQYY